MSETSTTTAPQRRPRRRRDALDRQLSAAVAQAREEGIADPSVAGAVGIVGERWVTSTLSQRRTPFATACLEAARRASGKRFDALVCLAAAGRPGVRRAIDLRGADYELAQLRKRPEQFDGPSIRRAVITVSLAALTAALRQPGSFTRTCMDRARTEGPLSETGYAWIELAAAGPGRIRRALPDPIAVSVRATARRGQPVFQHGSPARSTAFQTQLAQVRKQLFGGDLATA